MDFLGQDDETIRQAGAKKCGYSGQYQTIRTVDNCGKKSVDSASAEQ